MHVTVVFEDYKVNVDGDPRFNLPITPANSNWRVIQWYDTFGNIEVYLGSPEYITDFAIVQPYYDAWVAAAPPPPDENAVP